jgi:hypothetical protein
MPLELASPATAAGIGDQLQSVSEGASEGNTDLARETRTKPPTVIRRRALREMGGEKAELKLLKLEGVTTTTDLTRGYQMSYVTFVRHQLFESEHRAAASLPIPSSTEGPRVAAARLPAAPSRA